MKLCEIQHGVFRKSLRYCEGQGKTDVWYSSWAPNWLLPVLRHITPDHISEPQLVAEMNQQLKIPGVSNSWTMPIRGRIDMLSTGIRTPLGLKIQGDDVKQIRNTPDAFLSGFCRIWPAACDEQSGVNIGQWGIGSKSEGFVAKLSLLPAHGRDRQESGRGLLILHA